MENRIITTRGVKRGVLPYHRQILPDLLDNVQVTGKINRLEKSYRPTLDINKSHMHTTNSYYYYCYPEHSFILHFHEYSLSYVEREIIARQIMKFTYT